MLMQCYLIVANFTADGKLHRRSKCYFYRDVVYLMALVEAVMLILFYKHILMQA
jgi:hypothetical protein